MRGSAALCACWKAWPAARIRRSRRSGVIFYIVMITTTAWSTTSAPPTAEPLLKEKPFGGRSIQRSQIATNDKCTQPSPPWHTDFNRRGLAKPDRRGNIQGNGWRLRRSGHAEFSLPRGTHAANFSAFQLHSISFHVTTQPSLVLSWAPRKYRPPRFPCSPRPSAPSCTKRRCLS